MAHPAQRSVTIQAHAWNRGSGTYVATDQIVDTNAADLQNVKISSPRIGNRFLKGPIPWNWIIGASQLPGKALVIGLCLWRLKGATRQDTIKLSNNELLPFGIDRAAKSRGLAALEKAGLIKVDRTPGRWCNVTLLT